VKCREEQTGVALDSPLSMCDWTVFLANVPTKSGRKEEDPGTWLHRTVFQDSVLRQAFRIQAPKRGDERVSCNISKVLSLEWIVCGGIHYCSDTKRVMHNSCRLSKAECSVSMFQLF
jgi:hypothetical protein